MKTKLLDRAPFCPIGVKSNTRTLPKTFAKLCIHYQSQGGPGRDTSVLHQIACDHCPVAKPIRKGIDPLLVVGDIEWIQLEEILQIQDRINSINTALGSIQPVPKKGKRKEPRGHKMKRKLQQMRELLNKLDGLLSSIIAEVAEGSDSVETAQDAQDVQVADVVAPVETPVVKAAKKEKKMKKETEELARTLYLLAHSGKSRAFLATKYKRSVKYVSALIRHHELSLKK